MNATAPQHAMVWFEIPVTDMERAKTFYGSVLETTLMEDDTGPNPMAMFPTSDTKSGLAGHLYPGKPAARGTGATVHLLAPTPLEAALERWKANGGEVVSDVITIPPGRFAYCLDLDGNSIGLFTR